MTIGINGMAHVILTVSRFEVAREFYRKLLPQFGMKPSATDRFLARFDAAFPGTASVGPVWRRIGR